MKAVILASGAATRLRPLTDNVPKCLIEVNGDTILGRMLRGLERNGVKDILITTGHMGDAVREYVKSNFPGLNVEYVHNPMFGDTNYIYSMWLAKDKVTDDDILLLHGDLVFDETLLERAVNVTGSMVLVNKSVPPPEKDFKGLVVDGHVKNVGVNVFGDGAFFLAPMYRLSKEAFKVWMSEINRFVGNGKVKCYAEDAFNNVSHIIKVAPLYYTEFCMEIDTPEDLEKAKKAPEMA